MNIPYVPFIYRFMEEIDQLRADKDIEVVPSNEEK